MSNTAAAEPVTPATTSAKARNGGIASAVAVGAVTGLMKAIEETFGFDIPAEIELAIVAAVTGAVTSFIVWLWPNKPKE